MRRRRASGTAALAPSSALEPSSAPEASSVPGPRSRLLARDIGPLAALGLRSRPLRAVLSAAGVALGIATMVAVLGISSSSRAQLVAQIDALGTNLLTV